MSIRTTLGLVIVVAIAAVVVYINPFKDEVDSGPEPPWFYQVSEDAIETIEVVHDGKRVKFVRDEVRQWEFEEHPGVPPAHRRWGGMVLMLTGPKTRRLLQESFADKSQYGLADPSTIVDVTLSGDRRIQVFLGDPTTDGGHLYGQITGHAFDFPQLFLINAGWGKVLTRLVSEPPFPKWFVKRDPALISELSVIKGEQHGGDQKWLQFKSIDGEWVAQLHGIDRWRTPVDVGQWEDVKPLLRGPEFKILDTHIDDFTAYGIYEKSSSAIHLRFEGLSDKGVVYDDGVVYLVGDKTPDGTGYYAKTEEGEFEQPLLWLEAVWVEQVLDLRDDIPYAHPPRRAPDQLEEGETESAI